MRLTYLLLALICLELLRRLTPDMAGLDARRLWLAVPHLLHAGSLACASCGKDRAAEDLYIWRHEPHPFTCIDCTRAALATHPQLIGG